MLENNNLLMNEMMSSVPMKFTIEDTGIGIKDSDKGKLFKIFGKLQQYDDTINPSGIGLGLTICNNILKNLDSELKLESKYGSGTKFSFVLSLTSTENENIYDPYLDKVSSIGSKAFNSNLMPRFDFK